MKIKRFSIIVNPEVRYEFSFAYAFSPNYKGAIFGTAHGLLTQDSPTNSYSVATLTKSDIDEPALLKEAKDQAIIWVRARVVFQIEDHVHG
jgi:hypothetical protein